MALKDWKKVGKDGWKSVHSDKGNRENYYLSKKYVQIVFVMDYEWIVLVHDFSHGESMTYGVSNNVSSRKEALKMAMDYMKKDKGL